jgi:hypothetical protein
MDSSSVRKVFSNTLNNLKQLFKPEQQLEPETETEEDVHLAARIQNPWQEELDRLVANRLDTRKDPGAEVVKTELSDLTDMARQARDQAHAECSKKAKRSGDGTVTDLKAWWGESVVTWDPDIADTLYSNQQKPESRAVKRWFR